MKTRATLAIFAVAALTSGCGIREPLAPPPGHSLPIASALSTRAATSDELLQVTDDLRPQRVDEPLTRSTRRQADRFALPPPDVATEAPPAPANSSTDEQPLPTDRPQPQSRP
jgi:hypothetical protein